MKSMTGFGCSEKSRPDGIVFKADIRSVNKKQLDIRVFLPPELNEAEFEIRKILSETISRGSVNLRVSMTISGEALNKGVRINSELIEFYLKNAKALSDKFDLQYRFEAKDLYKFPYVVEEALPDLLRDDVLSDLYQLVREAVASFDKIRAEEGAYMKRDIESRLCKLEEIIARIKPFADALPASYKEKLKSRIEMESLHLPDNEERLLRELVIFSDRCDVSEEITRLCSHFKLFRKYLDDKDNPCGRSIDFLIQEIAREINTLGVKAAGTEVTPMVVGFKTELEKIREQTQNVE